MTIGRSHIDGVPELSSAAHSSNNVEIPYFCASCHEVLLLLGNPSVLTMVGQSDD
jgi:hypothetical protein